MISTWVYFMATALLRENVAIEGTYIFIVGVCAYLGLG
jgi:hypothetical protein